MTPVEQAIAVCVATFFAWQSVRWLLSRDTLNNVQGPATASSWKGNDPCSNLFAAYGSNLTIPSGHLPLLFNRHGWNFHRELSEKYGSVVALRGVFGVSGAHDVRLLRLIV